MFKKEGGLRVNNIIKKSKKNLPLISIITTNLNSQELEKTIKSVFSLKYENIEYIIIDGGSNNKVIDLLKSYNNKIDYWISEPDLGIWDAFNKGYNLARGDYIGIVPSDDILYPNSINYLINYINRFPEADFIVGSVKKNKVYSGFYPERIKYRFNLLPSFVIGFFLKRSSREKIGFSNLQYKYCSDYDFLYRMIVHHKMRGISTKHDELFGEFKSGGYSSRAGFFLILYWELKIRFNNNQNILILIFILFGRIYKKIFYKFNFFKNDNRT